TDKIVSEQNKSHVTTIIALGLVIYLAVLTKLYGLILGIACPVYILLHWRSFIRYSTENTVKISCLIGVFILLGVAVALALLGNNAILSYGNSQAETYVGYNEFMRGLNNPQQEFMYAFTSFMVTLVLNFHFGLFFLFGRGSRPSLPKSIICFVCVFLVFLLPFGAEVLFNIRFFIPILPFVVVAIVQGVSKFKQVALKRGIFLLYVSAASVLILNYNLETAYRFLLPLNEKVEATVFGEQGLFDNLRMKEHLQFAEQIELLNLVIEPNGDLYWLSSYYETSTHRVIKRIGIRPDIKLHCLLYPTALPEKTLYIVNYYKSFSSWRRRLKKRFDIKYFGSDLWRFEPFVRISGPVEDNFFQPGQAIPLHAELAEVTQSQVHAVNFVLDNQIIASDTVPPYLTTWPALGVGHHLAEVRIYTYQGHEIASAPLPLFVGVRAFERSLVEYNDDGEELSDGTMYLTSSDLELTVDLRLSAEPQMVGMRFPDIQIPQGAF
ncbi:MAG: hypothetical protein D3923_15340, partial [Candidatus Electrothrix sp. AR3]|nr:hypothetical protein [Candidatus Electrothrix sp. AR3]